MASNEDSQKKLRQLLSGISPSQLQQGLTAFHRMSKDGRLDELKTKMASVDQDKVLEAFSKLDPETIKRKLSQTNLDTLDIKNSNIPEDLLK